MGPRTVPWGTPDVTGIEEEDSPSSTMACDLSEKVRNPGMSE